MIFVHTLRTTPDGTASWLERNALEPQTPLSKDVIWIDLVSPTRAEDQTVEDFLGIAIPTRDDMRDIEPSELLYQENEARYLTARLLCHAESNQPVLSGMTFILKGDVLVTVRYEEPKAFGIFLQRHCKAGIHHLTAEALLADLIEAVIDRAADVLQMVGDKLDLLSSGIFAVKSNPGARNKEYHSTLRSLGRFGDLVSKARESLVSIERILLFLTASYRAAHITDGVREEVRSTLRDLQSLEEHTDFLTNKVQFLLDATLGLVNLEQNNIIKLFSVMAVVFMPPTLIASIYGMNFKHMPELEWLLGYPLAVFLMLIAAIVPYLLFRWKRWL
jgi:magnesium transporter